jgi:methionyl-tRNA formyltransferase
MSSTEIFNLYRSIYSFKHMQTTFKNEPVKIIEVSRAPDDLQDTSNSPGHLTFCRRTKKLLVECADGKLLEIRQISIGKKKVMSAVDFNNGFLKKCTESERCFR